MPVCRSSYLFQQLIMRYLAWNVQISSKTKINNPEYCIERKFTMKQLAYDYIPFSFVGRSNKDNCLSLTPLLIRLCDNDCHFL